MNLFIYYFLWGLISDNMWTTMSKVQFSRYLSPSNGKIRTTQQMFYWFYLYTATQSISCSSHYALKCRYGVHNKADLWLKGHGTHTTNIEFPPILTVAWLQLHHGNMLNVILDNVIQMLMSSEDYSRVFGGHEMLHLMMCHWRSFMECKDAIHSKSNNCCCGKRTFEKPPSTGP